jgi:prepilin-type N-terminal cleavage/methylation domain-containing protein
MFSSRRWRFSRQRLKGFSLIEAMIALAIASIIGVGAISLLSSTYRTSLESRKRADANSFALQTIETILSLTGPAPGGTGFDAMLQSGPSPFSAGNGGVTAADLGAGGVWTASKNLGKGFVRTLSLGNAPGDPATLLTLVVKVAWGGNSRAVTLTTKVLR